MRRWYSTLIAGCLGLLGLTSVFHAVAASEPADRYRLEAVSDSLFRFVNDQRAGVVFIARDGIVVGDPMDNNAATWLKETLSERFAQPVRYVFYSHLDEERASGASVFAEQGALIIAHDNARLHTAAVSVPAPDLTFSDRATIHLGNTPIELHYLGPSLSDDRIVALFPSARAAYASDFVSVEQLPPGTLDDARFPDWFGAIDRLSRLDFVYLLPAHDRLGIRSDAVQHGQYLRELHNRVRRARNAGVTLEDMQQHFDILKYRKWSMYDTWLPQNIEGIYQSLP